MPYRQPTAVSSAACRTAATLALALLSTSSALPASFQVAWHDALTVASGDAHVGPWRMNQSDFRYVDDPSVALGNDGQAAVVWVDQASQAVRFQRYDAQGNARLEVPSDVSRSAGTFSWLPRVVMAANATDTLYVLWQEILFTGGSHGGEILFAHSRDGGATFSEPLNLSNTRHGAGKGRLTAWYWHNGSLDLAEGPDGTLWAAWTEYEGRLLISRSGDGGHSFSTPVHVTGDDERPARGPSLAVNADGRVHLAWALGEDATADIHYAVSADHGETFATPQRVDPSAGHADAPKLAVDDRGRLHLVYAESVDGPRPSAHIRYTRAEAGEPFRTPQTLSSALAERFASQGFPHLAVSGDTVYVLWELFPQLGQRSRGLGMSGSLYGGDRFSPAVIVPHSGDEEPGVNGSLQGLLMRKLAVNADGELAVVNSTVQQGERSFVRLLRGRLAP
jgi:hypothetical protein